MPRMLHHHQIYNITIVFLFELSSRIMKNRSIWVSPLAHKLTHRAALASYLFPFDVLKYLFVYTETYVSGLTPASRNSTSFEISSCLLTSETLKPQETIPK